MSETRSGVGAICEGWRWADFRFFLADFFLLEDRPDGAPGCGASPRVYLANRSEPEDFPDAAGECDAVLCRCEEAAPPHAGASAETSKATIGTHFTTFGICCSPSTT